MDWFKKNNDENSISKLAIATLFIHAAKLDGMYHDDEKDTIVLCLKKLGVNDNDIQDLLTKAEHEEENNNQILHLTQEIKKINYIDRLKVIEMLLEIIYADQKLDEFEDNLIRRVAGLTYIENKDLGAIKIKIKNKLKL